MPKGSLWNYEIEALYQQYFIFLLKIIIINMQHGWLLKLMLGSILMEKLNIGIELVHAKISVPLLVQKLVQLSNAYTNE